MIHVGNVRHGQQIMQATDANFSKVTMQVISREENGELYGGVVFENYTGDNGSVEIHVGAFRPNWINRDMLWMTFDYPFQQLKVKYLFGRVPSKNTHAMDFNLSLGFEKIAVIEGVFPDDDLVVLRMPREKCRFLKIKPKQNYL
jgi:RimJ/RimL family protein N-acetyltransferase